MHSGAQFPLTLTLSSGERGQLSTAWDYSQNSEHFPALPMVLPLPEGEGWGAGEGRFRLNRYGLEVGWFVGPGTERLPLALTDDPVDGSSP